ncbi:MAG: sigma-54-dependent Fis family transcriptional regulator [Candidatus Lambdaproteobacteria bacterium]|nr:sigma-54-dependent Fis family transcriptional regulator [Candidatus Lambdaproteobacteria bacterium]
MSADQPYGDKAMVPEGLQRRPTILMVDADARLRKLLRYHLRRHGCDVDEAESADGAATVLAAAPADVVLFDLGLVGDAGMDALRRIVELQRAGCVIVTASHARLEDAVRSLRAGAYDFVDKANGFEDLRLAIRNALESVDLRQAVQQLRAQLHERDEERFEHIIGRSVEMARVMKLARKVMDSDITVLLEGESGSGKELVARAIHFHGRKRERPFVTINCAAIPETLLETELFGHAKGAFTGAIAQRVGKFVEAHEGTLFLDEIGELSLGLQAKLLRVLQTGEIEPVGGRTASVNVRVISATNLDLGSAVQSGRFRADLYYRLAVFPIRLPPLRTRRDDIPPLVDFFIAKFARQEGKAIRGMAGNVLPRLLHYDWPGNVRELENMIYRAVVLTDDRILTLRDFPMFAVTAPQVGADNDPVAPPQPSLPRAAVPPAPPATPPLSLEEMESQAIRQALAATGGNYTRAAALLKIGRATLYRKSKKFGLQS